MNFKFSRLKGITSILITVAFWIFIILLSRRPITSPNNFAAAFLSMHNMNVIFSFGNLFLFVIEVGVIYLAWSLFEKSSQTVAQQ